jgi:dTMP kinase
VSSLGDWIGVIAIAVFAQQLGGATAVGTVMTARVLPGFLVGPVAGVIADRFDRKRTMVLCDITRAGIIFSLPFVPNLIYLLVASAFLESLTLIWGPSKDASLPHFVPPSHLVRANSLSLLAIYGPWPLSTIFYVGLATLGAFLAAHVPVLSGLSQGEYSLALWVDAFTFAFSALMISTLTIPTSRRRAGRLDLGEIKKDLFEGLRFVRDDRQVRPWIVGIAFTFTAAGGVFSLGIDFANNVLGAGDRGYAFLIGFLATGMIIGLLAVGLISRRVRLDVLFSASILLLGVGLIALASLSSLASAIPVASALGFFGGTAYSTGYALIHEVTEDHMKGRTFGAAYTVIRIGTLVGLGLFPLMAGLLGNHQLSLPFGTLALPGSRVTLWAAGVVALGGGFFSMKAIKERSALESVVTRGDRGMLIVFEGGEGAGKTTQLAAFVKWLEARGEEVVQTREPGGTAIGARIRELLLDREASEMDRHAEALLYAADRAQHVAEVIRPALEQKKIVVSDRFIDSSLAYQGEARGLGVDKILDISSWATEDLMPDLVFYLEVDQASGLRRVGEEKDRIEVEDSDFHGNVREAYLRLATKFPRRFAVIDGSRSAGEVHDEVVSTFEERMRFEAKPLEPPVDIIPPGPPMPR